MSDHSEPPDYATSSPTPRARSRVRSGFATLCATAIVVAAASAAVAVAASSGTSHLRAQARDVQTAAVVQQVPAWISTNLSAFQRPQQADDIPPTNIIGPDLQQVGANPQLARLAGSFSGQSVYLVPDANSEICLASTSLLAHGCYDQADVLAGRVLMMLACYPYMPASQQETFGLLPGTSNVQATYNDGTTQAVPLQGDVFVLDATPAATPYPVKLSWQDSAGQQHSEDTGMTPSLPVPHPCTATTLSPTGATPAQMIAQARTRIAAGEAP